MHRKTLTKLSRLSCWGHSHWPASYFFFFFFFTSANLHQLWERWLHSLSTLPYFGQGMFDDRCCSTAAPQAFQTRSSLVRNSIALESVLSFQITHTKWIVQVINFEQSMVLIILLCLSTCRQWAIPKWKAPENWQELFFCTENLQPWLFSSTHTEKTLTAWKRLQIKIAIPGLCVNQRLMEIICIKITICQESCFFPLYLAGGRHERNEGNLIRVFSRKRTRCFALPLWFHCLSSLHSFAHL